jgi:hypothetical protein
MIHTVRFFSLGEWSEGRWHGQGTATFTNGDTYDGQYSFDQRHGKGIYSWNDGRVYSGGFVADRREGQGLYTWPDGAKFEGSFRDGQHDGEGEYLVSKKTIFLGGFGCCRRISLFFILLFACVVCRWIGIHGFLERGSVSWCWVSRMNIVCPRAII